MDETLLRRTSPSGPDPAWPFAADDAAADGAALDGDGANGDVPDSDGAEDALAGRPAHDAIVPEVGSSNAMRAVDATSMTAFVALEGWLAGDVGRSLADSTPWVWGGVPVIAAAGWVAADFVSGFFHFMADTIGSPSRPFIGPVFVRPFREHHVDPMAICRHDFLERNGASCAISLPVLAGTHALVPVDGHPLGLAVGLFVAVFLLGIFLTNEMHAWAHAASRPRWVTALQRAGLMLRPEAHALHHAPPFDRSFCITSGVLNPWLDRVRFFDRIREPLRRVMEPIMGRSDEEPAPRR